jgi:hypothetical protein
VAVKERDEKRKKRKKRERRGKETTKYLEGWPWLSTGEGTHYTK